MERHTWIFVLAAVAIAGIGVASWWSDADSSPDEAAAASEAERGRASHGGGASAEGAAVERPGQEPTPPSTARDPRAQLPRIPTANPAADPPAVGSQAAGAQAELPGEAAEAAQSSGWRLGATRRRIEMLDSRLEPLTTRVAELEASGDSAGAERQQRVVDRLTARLEELREEEPTLAAQAAADGSAAEETAGYDAAEAAGRAQGARSAIATGATP